MGELKKSNHQANIVRITTRLPHNNADTLERVVIGGYQVVVKKGEFNDGDLAIYIQPDSVVPQTEPFRFIWETYQTEDGTVPEKRRRITVRKFRGEWSEGLLMPMSILPKYSNFALAYGGVEGSDVSDILGITHYNPPEPQDVQNLNGGNEKRPKTLKGWFFYILRKLGIKYGQPKVMADLGLPVYDVEAYKNYVNAFIPGEMVYVTEKIHGSNARFVYMDGKMHAGSRNLWKSPDSNCVWRKALVQNPWIEEWCRENEGNVLYGEVVPTQGKFSYGCSSGEIRFFAFDIFTKDGVWQKPFHAVPSVPLIMIMPFDIERIKKFVDGPSEVLGAKNIREGVVVTPLTERHVIGLGRLQLKIVSNEFLKKDSQ